MSRRSRLSPLSAVVCALVTAVACAGCGLQHAARGTAVSVRVSRDFGADTLTTVPAGAVHGSPQELTFLRRHLSVQGSSSLAHGVTVRSVDGRAAPAGSKWFLFVNGVSPALTAGTVKVHPGDRIWLDLHSTRGASTVPAVVGSFPEPFDHGIAGRRYPATIAWTAPALKPAAESIIREFTRRFGIPLSPAGPGYGANDVLSINVGTFAQLSGEVISQLIRYGPGASGVYARFVDGGSQLDLENAAGEVVRRLGPDSGLIAATANTNDPAPTWLVTGTDLAGVRAAARALTPQALAGHFALAVHGTTLYPLPATG